MDQFRARFLGQVAIVSRRSLGQKEQPGDLPSEEMPGCTFLGFQGGREPSLTTVPDLQAKVDQAKASGLLIKEVPSSRSRSAFVPPGTIVTADMVPGMELWACPAAYQIPNEPIMCKPGSTDCGPGTAQPPNPASPAVQPLPAAPVAAKPDLVPVAAGAGVVAILAAIIGGAFGK